MFHNSKNYYIKFLATSLSIFLIFTTQTWHHKNASKVFFICSKFQIPLIVSCIMQIFINHKSNSAAPQSILFHSISISSIDSRRFSLCNVAKKRKISSMFLLSSLTLPNLTDEGENRERLSKIMNVKKGLEAIKKFSRVLHVHYKNSLKRSLLIHLLSRFLFTIFLWLRIFMRHKLRARRALNRFFVCFCQSEANFHAVLEFFGMRWVQWKLGVSSIKNRIY